MTEDSDKYDYQKIEKYISNKLSESEQALFEQEVQTDSELKKEVDSYKKVHNELAYKFKYKQEDNEFQALIEDLGYQYFSKKSAATNLGSESEIETLVGNKEQSESEQQIYENSKPAITKRLFIIGAFAAAATVLFFLFNPFKNQLSSAQLAEQHFKPYELQTIMNSGNNGVTPDSGLEGSDPIKNTESKELLKKGKKYYNEKDYALAKQYFDQYLIINPNDIDVQLAKGSCEFKLGQTSVAIQTFGKMKDSNAAQWYLALAYLKNKETEKAKPILKSLSNNDDKKYTKEAKEILLAL